MKKKKKMKIIEKNRAKFLQVVFYLPLSRNIYFVSCNTNKIATFDFYYRLLNTIEQ